MSRWTSGGLDSEDVADNVGEPGATAAADSLVPPCAEGVPDNEEEREAAVARDGPAQPRAAIHSHGPIDATLS